jgi:hypothetical protein
MSAFPPHIISSPCDQDLVLAWLLMKLECLVPFPRLRTCTSADQTHTILDRYDFETSCATPQERSRIKISMGRWYKSKFLALGRHDLQHSVTNSALGLGEGTIPLARTLLTRPLEQLGYPRHAVRASVAKRLIVVHSVRHTRYTAYIVCYPLGFEGEYPALQ